MQRLSTPLRRIALAAICAGAAGCASFSPDGGYAEVRQLAQQRTGDTIPATAPGAGSVEREVAALLAKPLSADDAVTVALLNNRGLQAGYAELGIAEADLVQAGRIANPVFSFGRLKSHEGIEIERKLMLPVIGLLTMPVTTRLERRRYEQAQLRAAGEVLRTADATRRAWYGAVAAQQSAEYMEQVKNAAEASAELARRMAVAGNWSKLQHAREQAFYADSVAQLARARQTRTVEREKLTRLMGLSSPTALTLPQRLPDLPAAPREVMDAEAQAMNNRLDMLMAQKELAGLASSLSLTRVTRFVNLLDLSYLRNTGETGERATGYEIELQIPLFDWGGTRVAKAEAMYMQAVQRAAGAAVDARSQVRESYGAYRTAYDLARHYRDEVVPLKKRIADEQLLRYNGMLISVFELLADAREQVVSVNAAIEAQRDYWIADAALQAALTGSGESAAAAAATSAPRAGSAAPAQH
ncbi:TolC family protein [Massilia pseudoviolaceinigra]|uniref:TolC family protein n=1 Tax=Massilia pseudoviolaceinigra TaxID=3057165 RepID=UPI002796751E|nr:TolC family protein [Massilia sp. CCM 9206]MDQ1923976.1 TolC family protein [Massilia sp. CCM 9206]